MRFREKDGRLEYAKYLERVTIVSLVCKERGDTRVSGFEICERAKAGRRESSRNGTRDAYCRYDPVAQVRTLLTVDARLSEHQNDVTSWLVARRLLVRPSFHRVKQI